MEKADQKGGPVSVDNAFHAPRNFLSNRFVYVVVSQRARGLSVGVDLNPAKDCNFRCIYCEVDRSVPGKDSALDLSVMSAELLEILTRVRERRISELPGFANLPKELLELKEVALSGSGEPTLCPDFPDALGEVIRIRAKGLLPFFKIVVITNTSGLPRPEVREALRSLGSRDEVWAKLDAGTQEYMDEINAPDAKLADVMSNILGLAAERPVVIQSLFPLVRGQEPASAEVDQYINRLRELKAGGAKISLVQIYSAHRPPRAGECDHLPLNRLSNIARRVRAATGLRVEVF